MVIDRNKHNKYIINGYYKPSDNTTTDSDQESSGDSSENSSSSSGSSSTGNTIIISGGGGMLWSEREKLEGIEEGAQKNQNAYSNITVNSDGTEVGKITAQQETDNATFNATNPIVLSLVNNIITISLDWTDVASKDYVIEQIDKLVGAAPGALDTLEELAQALGDDPNFATTVTNLIAGIDTRVTAIEKDYAKLSDIKIANITDLNSGWDSILLNAPKSYVTRWPSWSEVTDKPSWVGESKPSYSFADITNKPTTLAGYGITDAFTQSEANNRFAYKGGSNATGTWPISIDNYAGYLRSFDTRDVANTPVTFASGVRFEFKKNATDGLQSGGSYHGILHFRPYGSGTDITGGTAHEIGFTSSSNLYHRYGADADTWGAWKLLLDTTNYTSYTVTKTGGGASGTWPISISGNASTASKWATARTISLTGAVTGSVSIDGSGNVSLATTYATGNISALDSRYVKKSGDTMTGALTISNTSVPQLKINGSARSYITFSLNNQSKGHVGYTDTAGTFLQNGVTYLRISNSGLLEFYTGTYNTIWHAGNDGSGSGLDADLLDGAQSSRFFMDQIAWVSSNTDAYKLYNLGVILNASGNDPSSNSHWPESYGVLMNFPYIAGTDNYRVQMHVGTSQTFKYRIQFDGTNTGWITLARTIDNVASATKLQTARTINGTAFDGTANITTSYWGTARTLTLTGDATGSVSMNGSANVSMTVDVNTATTASKLSSIYTGNGGKQPPSYFNNSGLKVNMMNIPVTYSDVMVINGYNSGGYDVPYINAIAFQKTANSHGGVYHARADYGSDTWGTWHTFLDSYNYVDFTVTKTGVGASGTWPISIKINDIRDTNYAPSDSGSNKVSFWFNNTSNPTDEWYSGITMSGWTSGSSTPYAVWQLAGYSSTSSKDTNLYFRRGIGSTWGSWKTILDSSNWSSFINVSSASSAAKLTTARTITITGDASWAVSFDGSKNVSASLALASTGVGAGSVGPTANASVDYTGSFTVPYITFDAKGRATVKANRTITLPSHPKVTTLSTRTTNGNWTITGVATYRPLFIVHAPKSVNPSTCSVIIDVLSGALEANSARTIPTYALGKMENEYWGTNVFLVIPTSTTVVLLVNNCEDEYLRAYQL